MTKKTSQITWKEVRDSFIERLEVWFIAQHNASQEEYELTIDDAKHFLHQTISKILKESRGEEVSTKRIIYPSTNTTNEFLFQRFGYNLHHSEQEEWEKRFWGEGGMKNEKKKKIRVGMNVKYIDYEEKTLCGTIKAINKLNPNSVTITNNDDDIRPDKDYWISQIIETI